MNWEALPEYVDTAVRTLKPVSVAVKAAVAPLTLGAPVVIWADLRTRSLWPHSPTGDTLAEEITADVLRRKGWTVKQAKDDLTQIPVATVPFLRRFGEAINLFRGKYPLVDVENHPGPIGSVIAGGALGAGSLFALGKVLSWLMPEGFGGNLPYSLGLLGGLLGLTPGATWGYANMLTGRKFNDPSLLNPPGNMASRNYYLSDEKPQSSNEKTGADWWNAPSEFDVHVPSFRRTTFLANASPSTTQTGEAIFRAASTFPDPYSPGPQWVTGRQLGQLATGMAKDYTKGLLFGAAVNAIVGTPFSSPAIGAGVAAAGALRSALDSFLRPSY